MAITFCALARILWSRALSFSHSFAIAVHIPSTRNSVDIAALFSSSYYALAYYATISDCFLFAALILNTDYYCIWSRLPSLITLSQSTASESPGQDSVPDGSSTILVPVKTRSGVLLILGSSLLLYFRDNETEFPGHEASCINKAFSSLALASPPPNSIINITFHQHDVWFITLLINKHTIQCL